MTKKWQDPFDRYFDDFEVGDEVITRGRTVDAGDITLFAGLTGDYYPLHVDEEYARSTQFGTRIAHGPLTFTLAVGLVGMSGFLGNAVIALLGIDGMRAKKPVKAGDTVHVVGTVTSAVANESGRTGAVTIGYSVRNQHDDEVMFFEHKSLMRCRQES